MTAGDARRSRLADERAEWPARPSVAESPALGVNGANFVRIAPSWLSRDGGLAQTDLPRNRGLPGEKPPPSTISPMKSRSSRPRMFAPEDVLGAADAYGASGADMRELGKTQPRASQQRRALGGTGDRALGARLSGPPSSADARSAKMSRASAPSSPSGLDKGEAPRTPGRASAGSGDRASGVARVSGSRASRSSGGIPAPTPAQIRNMLPGEELIKTSEDIVEYYVRNGLGAPIKVFYCVAAPTTNTGYTPYDLVVVPKEHVENKDVEHYTVTSSGATLVYADGAGGEFTPLGDWMRDASVFALMRQMRFFREYLIKKAFNFWRGNVRYKMYALVRAKIERKLARARRKFVPAVVEIGALCDELRTTAAITINPLVTHTLDDFTRNQETQLTQVAIPAIEAAQEKARKILERVVRDVADEAKEVAAAVAATGGIDSFVSKTKSMVALKRERHERARTHKRVDEERAMLPVLVRLADYMLTEATVEMANANLRKLLDVVERPDPKSKGALSACVAFERGDVTAFEPDERTVLATVNGTVLDGVARAVGAAPRVAYASAFQPLLEAAARASEGQETFPLSKGEGFSPHSNDSAHPEGSASESETHNLDQPSRRAPTRKAYEGLGPMAVLLADATWLSMRASLDAKIASSFAEAREYVKTYEDLRPIHAFGASWNREEYEKAPKTVAAFRADMLVQRGWGQDLDRMKTSATAGCVFVDGKPLRTELVGTVHGMLESMKALLLVKAREEAIKAGTNFTKRIKTLLPRPEDLDGFMSLVEQHQKHAAAKASYVAEHATVEDMFGMLVEYEMKIPAADQVRLDDLNEARNGFLEAMRSAGEYVESKKAEMMKALKTGVADVEEALFREQTSLNTGMYMDRESDPAEVVQALAVVRATLDAHGAKCDLYKRYQKLFNTAVGAFSSLDLAVKEYDQKHDSWDSLFRFRCDSSGWMSNACETLELDAITNGVDDAYTAAYKMLKLRRDDQVVMRTREEIEAFRKYVPLLNEVANPALQPRHWEKIFAVFEKGAYDPEHPPTASDLLEWGALDKLEQLENIGANASKEYSLAQTLKKMTKEWEGQEFRCVPYKDTGTYVLGGSDEAQALLDDQIVKAQGMCASPFVKPFEADAKAWSATLNTLQDMLDNWLKCQQTWLYLEPIFSSEDIVKQMPEEGEKFRQVDNEWRDIMNATKEAPDVITIGKDKERLDRLEECNILLDAIQKGLSAYLEKKRLFFPRFFFLSNDEMLEILSETKDPTRVQPHLKKCFEGVAKLKFEGEDFLITAMISEEQEEVPLMNPISVADANGAVEKWLLQTEAAMFDSIHNVTDEGLKAYTSKPRDQWVLDWPGMVVLVCTAVNWTADVTRAIGEGKGAVKAYEEKCTADLLKIVDRVRGELTSLQRKTLGALVVMDVHARDVVSVLAKNGVASATDFDWQAQLRSYWEEDPREERDVTAIMRIMNAEVEYGYEYLGNSSRLVITPLTDRCYRTLMGAIHLTMGGAPEGPAGTGKTETTKDLAKALARQCVVFNCSDSMDYIQMGKFFKGLASSGAWACFDEFNRIDLEVLSVVAQQVLDIQRAISAKLTTFVFEGTEIGLKYSAWCSITMNPGYAGRSELPDNLKALFRTVAMMVPDYAMIGEIILYSFGYLEARDCATKIVQCYKLCSEQLSSQDHYDYGMRAVMAVLRAAGNLKRRYPEDDEYELMLRSIIDVNLCKFLSHDVPLFKGIISDLFPGVVLPKADYALMETAMHEACAEMNLQPDPYFFLKTIQLYEMIVVRHGLMIVGQPFSGKTMSYRVLARALSLMAERGEEGQVKCEYHVVNPKAITMGQLYGQNDPQTHEWQDGVLAVVYRGCAQDQSPNRKWVVLDGPVDAIWIENMNTVLDDNKKLCLNSGEIIAMSSVMNMIFEVADLAVASPATVSRCGMIYMEPTSMGVEPLLTSFLQTLPEMFEPFKEEFAKIFASVVPGLDGVLFFIRKQLKETVTTVDNCLVSGAFNVMSSLLKRYERDEALGQAPLEEWEIKDAQKAAVPLWVFSLIWGLGASVTGPGRPRLERFFRDKAETHGFTKHMPPASTSGGSDCAIFEFCYDQAACGWVEWMRTVDTYAVNPEAAFAEIIVPTADTVRYTYIIDALVKNDKHVLCVGETGTGKTLNVMDKLSNHMPDAFVPVFMTFSARTSANQTQDFLDGKMEKRRKGVFGPPSGKKYAVLIDDLNMPMREKYFAQPPIELLRQWMDHKGWYDRVPPCAFKTVVDVILVGCMGPPGGGRNPVSNRALRHFNFLSFTDMSDQSLVRIFDSILGATFVKHFAPEIAALSKTFVEATVEVYNVVRRDLLPTPAKSHYTFNLRDLARVFQGLLRADPKLVQADTNELYGLWMHENLRVFQDRMVNAEDRDWFKALVDRVAREKLSVSWDDVVNSSPPEHDEGEKDEGAVSVSTEGTHGRLIYGDYLVPGADAPVYQRVRDVVELRKVVEEALEDYNSVTSAPMNLVMFLDAIEHVSRVCRVISLPLGNALLLGVGGSGRQSLTRLAAALEEFDLFQIEVAKGYGKNEWRDDLRKVLMMAGCEGKDVVFLFADTQIVQENFLEDINNILNSGEVPNLLKSEDTEAIGAALRPIMQSLGLPTTKNAVNAYFITRVRSKLHCVLAMSPVSDSFRQRLRMFPSLVNCCTIDWFSEWPLEALDSVANTFLADVAKSFEDPKALGAVVESCVFIHQSVERKSRAFLEQLRRYNYVTPTSYLELLRTFIRLLGEKRAEIELQRSRLQIGLDKLESTAKQVAVMEKELVDLQPVLAKTSKEVEEMIAVITADTAVADETKVKVVAQEKAANEKAAEAKAIADDAQADLDKALPALDAAVQALKLLTKNDVVEVKALKNPPAGVRLVMEVACIFFGRKPKMVPDTREGAKPGAKMQDYWGQSTDLVKDPVKFLESLLSYDKDAISAEIIEKADPYMLREDFDPAAIKKVSKACTSICMWARAMHTYYNVSLAIEPKRAALAEAQASLEVTMGELAEAKATLAGVEANLAELNDKFEAGKKKQDELKAEVARCQAQLDRAGKLIGGLGGERTRWEKTVESLGEKLVNVVGDVVVSSGVVAYNGPFTPSFRAELLQEWSAKMIELKLPHTPGADIQTTLADPVQIRAWTIAGLPSDSVSVENGIIVAKARRWPLMIDPQGQANKWVKNMEKASNLQVIKLTDGDYLRTLENAIQFGLPVLLENVGEELDPSLEPLLLKQLFKSGGVMCIKLGDNIIEFSDQFRFYITTSLRNPHYLPETAVKVTLLNFMITPDGLSDQLLGVVVAEERPDLESQRQELVVTSADNKKRLKEIEDRILHTMSSSEGNILEDENAVKILSASKTLSDEISEKQKVADATEAKIDATRAGYRPVAKHSSIVFFCVADMASIGDMYQYSLQWFTDLFVRGIEDAPTDPRVAKRLKNITEHFTFFLYVNVCRSLFEKDKLLFSFLVTTKLLLAAAEENKRKAEEEAASVAKAEREAAEEEKRIADARAARIAAGEDVEAEERAAREAEERAALEAEEEARLAAEEAAEAAREAEENGSDGEDEDPERSEARLENDGELAFSDDDEPRAGEDDGDLDDAGGTKEGIESEELRFFLTGGISTGDVSKPNPAPEWLSDKAWGELLRMTDLPTVAARGDVPSDVANDPNRWKVLYDSPEPQDEALPSPFHESFSPLQRMLVLRAFRPDKVVPAITEYVGKEMGAAYVDPLPFDLDACFADSDAGTPLVFILSPGSDPMANLLKFAETKTRKKEGAKPDDAEVPTRVEAVSLGQGQGPFALRCIETGAKEGHWVVLQNCHLAKSFMPELEHTCELRLKREDVHPDFRLWLTSYPSPIFPVSILENSVKMTNEAPSGLKAGLARTFSSHPLSDSAFFETCTKDQTWRKMVFGLAFFHSFVQERAKYGAIGFNIPYQFNENDLRISIRQLKMFLDEYDETPYETLRYTCGECNYGGKVTDGHDRITVDCILKLFYTPEIVNDDYAFSPSGTYRAPKHGEYGEYLAYIDSLPRVAAPEVYGFHANADIAKDVKDTDEFLDAFSLTQSRDGVKGGVSPEEAIGAVAMDLSEKCPDSFDVERAAMKYPVDYFESMNTVLTQELVRVNALLAVVRTSLTNLGKAVKGLVLMSDELDQVGKALYDGKVPALWLKKSFPSLKPLGSYFKELVERCAFFETWVKEGVPNVFPLYAFFFTQAFLTGSKQNFARKYKVEIDKVDFDFKVLEGSAESYADKKPEDGVYCFGMFLDGAAWSAEKKSLTESEPKVLYAPCPGVHMIPSKIEDFEAYSNYSCPLYKTADRRGILSTTGHSTNFVMNIRLPSERDADHWIRRGACLLLSLKD
mmetsp:Transcript_6703/g.27190  ORF Transcript_6703/g.27190 Transcript_6703/m.27190 type:complete len:4341 (+) Transcript_6703:132-13154(+)